MEECHREGQKPLNRIESRRVHKGIQPVTKLGMSGGQTEVLIRGRSLQLPEQRAKEETEIEEDYLALIHYRDRELLDRLFNNTGPTWVCVTDLINEKQ